MIRTKHNAILVTNQHRQIIAELTYFLLPSQNWLLEQFFASSRANRKRYLEPLIQTFFKTVPKREHCVRILDPLIKADLKKRSTYQKYLHQVI